MDKGRVKPSNGLNLRIEPNGEKIGALLHDQEVEILDEVTYYRVKDENGQIGYVHGDYLEKLPECDDQETLLEYSEPGEVFSLVTFSDDSFIGEKIKIDKDFTAAMKRVAFYARNSSLKVWITSSTRALNEQVRGAIVPPANKSCHHVGHAIDMNLFLEGKLYNSKKLRRENISQLPEPIKKFINFIRDDNELRWGGDFNKQDPVHIDDDLYHKKENIYQAKLDGRIQQLNG